MGKMVASRNPMIGTREARELACSSLRGPLRKAIKSLLNGKAHANVSMLRHDAQLSEESGPQSALAFSPLITHLPHTETPPTSDADGVFPFLSPKTMRLQSVYGANQAPSWSR
jgi:hypothetical protein